MSTRSSRRKKTQPPKQSAVVSEDVSKTTAAATLDAHSIPTSGTHHTVEAQARMESDEYNSSSAQQRTDNGLVDESTGEKTAAVERTRGSDQSTKRQRATEVNEKDSSYDKAPASKRSKKTKDTQPLPAGQHTTAAKEESVDVVEEMPETQDDNRMETDSEDNMEEDNKQEHLRVAENDFSNTDTSELDMHHTVSYYQQKQTRSNVVHSSTQNDDVRLSSNAVSDKRSGRRYFAAESPQPQQRMVEREVHNKSVPERPQRWLSTYHSSHISEPSVPDRTPESPGQKGEVKSPMLCNILKYFVVTCVVAVLAVLLAILLATGGEPYYSRWLASMKPQTTRSGVVNYDMPLQRLREQFPSQSNRLWRIMEAATIPIIKEDDPSHPAVILLVASKGNSAVAECLAGRYAALVTESLNAAEHATFNCEMYADSDPDDAKSQLNTVLTRAFGAGSKSGVVLHLEKLPGPAAMIFYRFAENDNAPFKDVAIVLTLTLESTDTGSERDKVAYDELRKVWGYSLGADKLDPLLSRIGNSVAFVQPETKEVLAGLNC